MENLLISLPTVCGLEELEGHRSCGVTHVLSILDPDTPAPVALSSYDRHHGLTLHFHDDIEPGPGILLPSPEHVEAILAFGCKLGEHLDEGLPANLLVHCHMGISRSTAATAILLAQLHRDLDERDIFAGILKMRPQAWPNWLMVFYADEALGRCGRLTAAASELYATRIASDPAIGHFMRQNGRSREVEMAESFTRAGTSGSLVKQEPVERRIGVTAEKS